MIFVNFMIFVILGLLAYSSFYFARLAYKDTFAPVGLFLGVNLVSLALYHLNLIALTSVSTNAYALIFASLFSFLFGALTFSPRLVLQGVELDRRALFQDAKKETQGLAVFYYVTAILSISGWLALLFLSEYSLTQIIVAPDVLQASFQKQYIGYFNLLGILVPPSFILLTLARKRVTIISIPFLLGALVGILLAGIKSYLVFSMVISLLVWSAARPGKIRIKHLAILSIFVIGFMALYDYYIDIYVSHQFSSSKFSEALSFLERPYLYAVGSWPAMSAIIQNPPEQPHWAYLSLHFLWKILGAGLGLIPQIPDYEPFVNIGASIFNVYSLIGGLYWDYGPLGSLIGCFLLGAFSTFLYTRARRSRNWSLHLGSAIFNYGLFLSFFVYYYRFNVIFLLGYVLLFGFLSRSLPVLFKRHLIRTLMQTRMVGLL